MNHLQQRLPREKPGLNTPVSELPRTFELPPYSIVRRIDIGLRSKFIRWWAEEIWGRLGFQCTGFGADWICVGDFGGGLIFSAQYFANYN